MDKHWWSLQCPIPKSPSSHQTDRPVSRWEHPSSTAGSCPLLPPTASWWCCCGVQPQLTLVRHWTQIPALWALDLFSSCRSVGGIGAVLLVPDVMSFQPLLSFPNPTGTDLACLSFGTAVGLRLLYPQDLREAQVTLFSSSLTSYSLLTSAHSSFPW